MLLMFWLAAVIKSWCWDVSCVRTQVCQRWSCSHLSSAPVSGWATHTHDVKVKTPQQSQKLWITELKAASQCVNPPQNHWWTLWFQGVIDLCVCHSERSALLHCWITAWQHRVDEAVPGVSRPVWPSVGSRQEVVLHSSDCPTVGDTAKQTFLSCFWTSATSMRRFLRPDWSDLDSPASALHDFCEVSQDKRCLKWPGWERIVIGLTPADNTEWEHLTLLSGPRPAGITAIQWL